MKSKLVRTAVMACALVAPGLASAFTVYEVVPVSATIWLIGSSLAVLGWATTRRS